jgi:DNA-binding winged helix-turn-helix (wHTH) protein/tetratricopeptide (TPR) repeat protein
VFVLKLADLAMREDFSLGPLWVSPAVRSIKGSAGELHIEPLIMQVFLLLADAKGQVVTRDQLYDECWGGVNVGDYSLNRAITMVRRIAAEAAPGAFTIESIPRTGYRLLVEPQTDVPNVRAASKWRAPALVGAAIGAILFAGSAWLIRGESHREPSVGVAPTDPGSAELARAISNGTLTTAAAYQTPLRVLDGADASMGRANFILKVAETGAGDDRKVELALVSGEDKSLLWSWSAKEPGDRATSLERQARVIGASVLTCAAETQDERNGSPDQETVKLYLDACSRFEPSTGAELKFLPDAFARVTAKAPQLRGAWSKLFLSKAEAIEGSPPINMVDSLKKDISDARDHGIEVPETYIARAAVLPLNARFERLHLYEAGIARYPRNPFLLAARSWQLRSLGRMDEAARTALRLTHLYPQSAAASTEFANSLMNSGRIGTARRVLEKADKLTPGAPNLEWARWRLEMRYGDPTLALRIARDADGILDPAMVSFLEARSNPSEANIERALVAFRAHYRAEQDPGVLAQALGTFGRTEDAIQLLLHYDGGNSGDGAEILFRPPLGEVRRDPRFMQIARNFGLVDYWGRSGILPDFCYEPGLPYDCKRELARIGR